MNTSLTFNGEQLYGGEGFNYNPCSSFSNRNKKFRVQPELIVKNQKPKALSIVPVVTRVCPVARDKVLCCTLETQYNVHDKLKGLEVSRVLLAFSMLPVAFQKFQLPTGCKN